MKKKRGRKETGGPSLEEWLVERAAGIFPLSEDPIFVGEDPKIAFRTGVATAYAAIVRDLDRWG